MSKQAFKRVRRALGMQVNRDELPAFAWPGGYPILYVFADGGACCPKCVNKEITLIDADMRAYTPGTYRNSHGGWALGGWDVNYEDADLHCDHCGKPIDAAYAD
jgi:hypothetical protein